MVLSLPELAGEYIRGGVCGLIGLNTENLTKEDS